MDVTPRYIGAINTRHQTEARHVIKHLSQLYIWFPSYDWFSFIRMVNMFYQVYQKLKEVHQVLVTVKDFFSKRFYIINPTY